MTHAEYCNKHKDCKRRMPKCDVCENAFEAGKEDAIEEFADYLKMSFDKGMKLSIAMADNDTNKIKIKGIYSKFIESIDDCVDAFMLYEK